MFGWGADHARMLARWERFSKCFEAAMSAALGASATSIIDLLHTVQNYEAIDWARVKTVAITGAMMGFAAFWRGQIQLNKEPPSK